MIINIQLVKRGNNEVIGNFDFLETTLERIMDLEGLEDLYNIYEMDLEDFQKLQNKYIFNIELTVKDGSYIIKDFKKDFTDISIIEDNSIGINNLEDLYNNIDNQDEIPFLNEIFENDWGILEDYFETKEQAVLSVIMGDYYYNDEYVYFNGYGNLVTLYEIPYKDYSTDIFEQWLEEILY
nr:MAG TPA: hypothetical protein [Caudoviricetes sp.]